MGDSSEKPEGRSATDEELVLTPGGWRPKSKTFRVEPGQHFEVQDGRLRVIETATGKVAADLGALPEKDAGKAEGGRPMKKARHPDQGE